MTVALLPLHAATHTDVRSDPLDVIADDVKVVTHVLRSLRLTASPRLTLALMYDGHGRDLRSRSLEWWVRHVPAYAERAMEKPVLAAHVATMFLPDEDEHYRPAHCPFCLEAITAAEDVWGFDGTQGHFTCTTKLAITELRHAVEAQAGRIPA